MKRKAVAPILIIALIFAIVPSPLGAAVSAWTQLSSPSPTLNVAQLSGPSRDSDLVLAGTEQGSLFKSTNRGSSWANPVNSTDPAGFTGIAFSPAFSSDGRVVATTGDELWRSVNSASTFDKIPSPTEASAALSNRTAAYSPTADTIFVGTNDGLYSSTDNGNNWTRLGHPTVPGVAINAIAVSPSYAIDKTVYLGTNLGLYRVRNYTTPEWALILPDDIGIVDLLSPVFLFGISQYLVAATDIGLVLIKNAQSAPVFDNLSQPDANGNYYFPLNAYGAPTFDENDISALFAYKTPNVSMGIDILAGAASGVYRLTKVGTTSRQAKLLSSGVEGRTVNSLIDWSLDSYSRHMLAGTDNGIFSYIADLTQPTALINALPPVSTDLTNDLTFPVKWGGADSLSPIAAYEVQYRPGGLKTWWPWLKTAAASGVFKGKQGTSYYIRVRSIDGAGNTGAWAESPTPTAVPFNDIHSRIKSRGIWTTGTKLSGRYLKTVKRTKRRGAKMTFTFIGTRVWLIYSRGPKNSKADIYIDGHKRTTINTRGKARHRQRIQLGSWKTEKKHTVVIVNKATRYRPNLVVDGIAFARK